MRIRSKWVVTLLTCAAALLIAMAATGTLSGERETGVLKVGFVFSEDESTPYTANFIRAQRKLEEEYGDRVEIYTRSNVPGKDAERPILDLIRSGCTLLFMNLDSDVPVTVARENPEVTFCQVSLPTVSLEGTPENYHTFNGEVYQARYVSGIAAGLKLREMLDAGKLQPEEALVGYVGANSTAEVVSGYTAFLLGVRSVAPEAVMHVRTTGSWGNFNLEKEATRQLIQEGCVIISQHVNTAAPAQACEEATVAGRTVYHVGYHQSMMDVAPSSALISLRTNWAPYILQATAAVMAGRRIEDAVDGNAHGRDMSAGFESGWVEMLDLNRLIAAEGTEAKLERAIEGLKKGRIQVFSGPYTGVNPRNSGAIIDLSKGYTENANSSNPSFCYILQDCVVLDN